MGVSGRSVLREAGDSVGRVGAICHLYEVTLPAVPANPGCLQPPSGVSKDPRYSFIHEKILLPEEF